MKYPNIIGRYVEVAAVGRVCEAGRCELGAI